MAAEDVRPTLDPGSVAAFHAGCNGTCTVAVVNTENGNLFGGVSEHDWGGTEGCHLHTTRSSSASHHTATLPPPAPAKVWTTPWAPSESFRYRASAAGTGAGTGEGDTEPSGAAKPSSASSFW